MGSLARELQKNVVSRDFAVWGATFEFINFEFGPIDRRGVGLLADEEKVKQRISIWLSFAYWSQPFTGRARMVERVPWELGTA